MATAALPVASGGFGTLRVVPPAALDRMEQQQFAQRAALNAPAQPEMTELAAYIRGQFEMMRTHRNNTAAGWTNRLVSAMQTFNGVYDAGKQAEIAKFGGSDIFMRISAMKCRGASSLLRDVYLSPDRPWGLDPAADPDIPESILASIKQLVSAEAQGLTQAGQPIDLDAVRDRVNHLMMAARRAAKDKATDQARLSEEKLDEILTEGGFYKALQEFLVDLPIFPFACIKGPTVRIVPTVMWEGGKASLQQKPRLFWQRVSPFDIWFTPGVSDIEDASVVERQRLTRADLNDLLDLPSYNRKAIEQVLEEYGTGGLNDNWDQSDAERAEMENRENPMLNRSGLITSLEFQGNVQGKMLLQYGMTAEQIPDPIRDYSVQAWLIGRHVIKVQHVPSPRKRHNYYITSWEKVPGTPVGNGLIDSLNDIQSAANSTMRSLVNNMAIASGPQVVINGERLNGDENMEDLYPWKRWFFNSDPMANNSQVPISFFQPNSNAQELLSVYKFFLDQADELSGIPKYMSGSGAPGGAGRTASGLAMLMQNSAKLLQTVAANIDRDVLGLVLASLFDMVMLTDTSGLLSGQEQVVVKGVNVAVQRETQRSRQLELLQITANPVDMAIIGPTGRSELLRAVANETGLDGSKIVPDADKIAAMQKMHDEAPAPGQEAAGQAQGSQPSPSSTGDMGPRTNLQQQAPKPVAGGVH